MPEPKETSSLYPLHPNEERFIKMVRSIPFGTIEKLAIKDGVVVAWNGIITERIDLGSDIEVDTFLRKYGKST